MKNYDSILILGPTASGKTRLAAHLASEAHGAVLSFDSRQVYKQLTIGTGKDLNEFTIANRLIPYFLIDVCDVNTKFHSYEFVKCYLAAFENCKERALLPILCGGTGLYFDLVLKKHQYINIPNDDELRNEISSLTTEQLIEKLNTYASQNIKQADLSTRKRIIRAIEVAHYLLNFTHQQISYPNLKPIIFGINLSPTDRIEKINSRLEQRLKNGLIEEVQELLAKGINEDRLVFLGLEYKYITEFLTGKYPKETMITLLQTAIHQYAKRQMTWFRKMEREGNTVHWIDGNLSLDAQLKFVHAVLDNEK